MLLNVGMANTYTEPNITHYYTLVHSQPNICKIYNCVYSYRTMLQCWKANPLERPSFTELAEQLGVMLDDNIRRVSGIGGWFLH